MPVGFTPEVFTSKTGPLVQLGADRIIALHSAFGGQREREQVNTTIREIERVAGMKVEKIVLNGKTMSQFIEECLKLLNSFATDDIHIHLGGGERFLSLALIYASVLSAAKPRFVIALEMREGNGFTYDLMPAFSINAPSRVQLEILRTITGKPQRLVEVSKRADYNNMRTASAGVYRHLKKLKEKGFVETTRNKEYKLTTLGEIVAKYPL
jgi:predicted transcriptional regulator